MMVLGCALYYQMLDVELMRILLQNGQLVQLPSSDRRYSIGVDQ